MGEDRKSKYERISVRFSIIYATVGLLAALLFAAVLFALVGVGLHQILADPVFLKPVIVAVVMLFVAAGLLGLVAGNLIYRTGVGNSIALLIGVVLAWSCLFVSAVAGSSVNYFSEMQDETAFLDYLIRPVFGVMIVGSIPASVFGLLYAIGVRKSLGES